MTYGYLVAIESDTHIEAEAIKTILVDVLGIAIIDVENLGEIECYEEEEGTVDEVKN